MATVFGAPEAHPVAAAVARIHTELDHLTEVGCWSLTGPELADSLTSLGALRHQITELELRVARQAECLDLGAEAGAADTGSYWANATRQTRRDAKRRLELPKLLDHDHEPVGQRWPPARCPKNKPW